MGAARIIIALIVGASMALACGGVAVSSRALDQTERYIQEAMRWKAEAGSLRSQLEAMRASMHRNHDAEPAKVRRVSVQTSRRR